jgi:hypothetical protein
MNVSGLVLYLEYTTLTNLLSNITLLCKDTKYRIMDAVYITMNSTNKAIEKGNWQSRIKGLKNCVISSLGAG